MHGVPHFLPNRPRSAPNDHRRIGRTTQEYHASVTTVGLEKPLRGHCQLEAGPPRLL